MAKYTRSEMEEMARRWEKANAAAEREGDWATHLGPFYSNDSTYRWNMGPMQEFRVVGRREICELALGFHMKGFEQWRYPFVDVCIDDHRGTIVVFYRQVAPARRRLDGTPFEVQGISGSKFEYAGNFQWKSQTDFFDLGNVKSLFFEMAGEGALGVEIRKKIHEQAQGALLPGIVLLRDEPNLCAKISNLVAMIKIAIFG